MPPFLFDGLQWLQTCRPGEIHQVQMIGIWLAINFHAQEIPFLQLF